MLTIANVKVKHGPNCSCRACGLEWAEYRLDQQRIDEAVHRERREREHFRGRDREYEEHLERCGYYEPCDDIEETWVVVINGRP